VAAVAEQDLVQVVALLVAVEDRLDARVELRGPVRDWAGGGADAVGELGGELVLQRGQQVVLGAEVQVEQPFGDPGAAGDVVERSGRHAFGEEKFPACFKQVGTPLFGGLGSGHAGAPSLS
jgi:hypothetical protein